MVLPPKSQYTSCYYPKARQREYRKKLGCLSPYPQSEESEAPFPMAILLSVHPQFGVAVFDNKCNPLSLLKPFRIFAHKLFNLPLLAPIQRIRWTAAIIAGDNPAPFQNDLFNLDDKFNSLHPIINIGKKSAMKEQEGAFIIQPEAP